jgi:hypothetical protein
MPGLTKESDYASQSQALSGGVIQTPGYGNARLEYNHHFTFNYSGSNTVKMEITVKGMIPLNPTQTAFAEYQCRGDTVTGAYQELSGTGTVPFQASADFTSGSKHCSCSLPDSIEVNILGKTFYGWLADPGCQTAMVALQVKEKWFSDHKWQCTCNTPEEAEKMHVEENMAMFPMVGNPELEKKTMVFPLLCAEESSLEAELQDPVGLGSGSYQWTFRSGMNEPGDPGQRARQPNPLAQDQDQWENGEPIIGFGGWLPGMWGPALESITQ